MTIDFKDKQSVNALFPIDVTLDGIVINVSDLQEQKAQLPIDVTPFGMTTDDKKEHLEKT